MAGRPAGRQAGLQAGCLADKMVLNLEIFEIIYQIKNSSFCYA